MIDSTRIPLEQLWRALVALDGARDQAFYGLREANGRGLTGADIEAFTHAMEANTAAHAALAKAAGFSGRVMLHAQAGGVVSVSDRLTGRVTFLRPEATA